jgi:hypothetical protein
MTTHRCFTSLARTVLTDTSHVLDAVDAEGRAWWLIVGDPAAPEDWTELLPLPGDAPATEESSATQPDGLALRVQKLEAMRETERAAVLDLYQQIDKLKARLDWQYTKIGRLEDASIKDLAAAARAMTDTDAQP